MTQCLFCIVYNADLPQPKVLRDWSTVGAKSVSIVWRSDTSKHYVSGYMLYYRPLSPTMHAICDISSLSDSELQVAGYQRLKVTRLLPKRSQAVLRNLQPQTFYSLAIFATNSLVRSSPCVVYFHTAELNGAIPVTYRCPKLEPPIYRRLTGSIVRGLILLVKCCVLIYVVLSAVVLVFCRERFVDDACWFLGQFELYSILNCEERTLKPPPVDPVSVCNNITFFSWLMSHF